VLEAPDPGLAEGLVHLQGDPGAPRKGRRGLRGLFTACGVAPLPLPLVHALAPLWRSLNGRFLPSAGVPERNHFETGALHAIVNVVAHSGEVESSDLWRSRGD